MSKEAAVKVVASGMPWIGRAADALGAGPLPALPTVRDEAFHYTNLRDITTLPLEPDSVQLRHIAASLPVVTGPQVVMVNGARRNDVTLLNGLAEGITVTSGAVDAPPRLDALDDWHAAQPGEGLLVEAAKGNGLLHVMHALAGHGLPVGGHVRVVVRGGASLTLVEHLVGVAGSARWANPRVTVEVADGGRLTHVVAQGLPTAAMLTRRERVTLGNGARYDRFTLQAGGKLARIETHMAGGGGTNARLAGLGLTAEGQTHDTTLRMDHRDESPDTHVRQRNIVDAGGHAVFQGKFYVAEKAQKTNAYMLCQNLLLNEGARASGKPELEIYADDVKCSHGASTGRLQPEQLFYLAARGVPEAEARALLVQAFADEMMDGLPDGARETVRRRVERWLTVWAHGADAVPDETIDESILGWLQ
jgi:Fe-S cluster assembly protein SufD